VEFFSLNRTTRNERNAFRNEWEILNRENSALKYDEPLKRLYLELFTYMYEACGMLHREMIKI
jgi:hypothetical protein